MAETRNQDKHQNPERVEIENKTPENPRKAIRERREEARLRVIAGRTNMVTVYPANDSIREVLRHANGTRFRADVGEGVDWPNDSFTQRRIADGSVSTEAGTGGEAKPLDESLNAREQAAANRPKAAEQPAPASGNGGRAKPQPQPQPPQSPPAA